MVDISSQNNKINVTVSSSGNTANTNVTLDSAMYYSNKSKDWAISNRIVDNTDYSSKYYANESKKQADISTAKATEVIESGNTAVSNINSVRDNAIADVNTAGATQVALATEQATIATNKASEVVASGNEALSNIDTAKNNAITSITNQETTSKTSLIDEGVTQVGLIQNEGAKQVANVQSTGFYMRDDKLYYINSQGEETEFKSGGSSRNVGEIITSTLPLTDAGLHLLDGARLSGDGIYGEFVQYIADLYNDTKVYNPSAFTVVGSPTITADGIASGFSGSNGSYLRTNYKTENLKNKSWKIKVKFKTGAVTGAATQFVPIINFTNRPNDNYQAFGSIAQWNNTLVFSARTGISTDSNNEGAKINLANVLEANKNYSATLEYNHNTGIYILKAYDNSGLLLKERTWTAPTTQSNTELWGINNATSENYLCIGANREANAFLGSIDLKQFSITVDGKEVFSGSTPANYFTTEALWQQSVTDYGSCGKFVYDSVNKTVRLPKVTGIIEGTTDVSALGDLVEAGLPNIEGYAGRIRALDFGQHGALTMTNTGNGNTGGGSNPHGTLSLNASLSNPIYGNSSTVQPQTIKAFYYIVIANSTKTSIQVEIDEIATDLNGKADTDLTNTTDSAKVLMSSMGMPSDKYINLTLGASGATYTAPANGWYNLSKTASASGQWCDLKNVTNGFYISSSYLDSSTVFRCAIPVKKNDVLQISYNIGGGTNFFRFYYAVGSESEAS